MAEDQTENPFKSFLRHLTDGQPPKRDDAKKPLPNPENPLDDTFYSTGLIPPGAGLRTAQLPTAAILIIHSELDAHSGMLAQFPEPFLQMARDEIESEYKARLN